MYKYILHRYTFIIIHIYIYLSICLSVYLSIYIYLSICMDIPLDTHMSPVEERALRIVRHGEGHFSPFVRPVLAVHSAKNWDEPTQTKPVL